MLMTGAELDPERAYQFGLVSRVTEAGQALSGALELAAEICRSSPVSVRATLRALADQYGEEDTRGWVVTAAAVDAVLRSEDMQEGIAAFFERREPHWRGR
jgi:enoyl-CoA hydratase